MAMNHLTTIKTEDALSSLLEHAANNDIEGFKKSIGLDVSAVDEIGLWYGRQNRSKQMVYEYRTPLMVAATYGSIDVLKLILSLSHADINRSAGFDKSTVLHCAASGGAANATDVVKLLLAAGSDPNLVDANGRRPLDVIDVIPKLQNAKKSLEELLLSDVSSASSGSLRISTCHLTSNSPSLPSSPGQGLLPTSEFVSSPTKSKFSDFSASSVIETRKEYPVDPSLPDIKNSIYSTDDFRMYSFKVRPCSRAYSHDWTECPFVHPGENARRRDPRKFHYSCVPCPEFRKGACRRGDICEYAHGVFECWLHPAQYRTRLCKDGTNCGRRVCFFAHTAEELRPLYVSTGSAVPSPRSASLGAVDYAAAMNLLPDSPSSKSVTSPSPFSPPMSPSANWPQPNVPDLHLSVGNLQSSRLRSSLNARDIPVDDFDLLQDFDMQHQQLLSDYCGVSQWSVISMSANHSGRLKTLTPSNLDDLFTTESSSPRHSDQALASTVFSPTHKSAVLNQFQQQQSMLSPINTNFSPMSVDHHPLLASFGISSSERTSPPNAEPVSPISSCLSMLGCRENPRQFRSLSSRELGSSFACVGSPLNSWSTVESPNDNVDWVTNTGYMGKLRRSSSYEVVDNGEEPDFSWVQSLVKDSPSEMKEKAAPIESGSTSVAPSESQECSNGNASGSDDHALLAAWLEQMQLDHLAAQQNCNTFSR